MIVRELLLEIDAQLTSSPMLAGEDEHANLAYEGREIVAVLLNKTPGDVGRCNQDEVDARVVDQAREVVNRRARGEPLAYALGSAAFRHLVLHVDPRVLIPRPETEVVVEEALKVIGARRGGIAVDIGTGSGAIALSLATEGRFDHVIATDVSPGALAVAQGNYARLVGAHCTVEFRLGADLVPIAGIRACLLVSNPPYIAEEEAASLPASVRDWEPALALFADGGGMARYDALFSGAPDCLEPGGWIVLEVDARRAGETARRATGCGRYTDVRLVRDLTGRERVLVARLHDDSAT